MLVFPSTLDGLALELGRHGIDAGTVTPSVVVRDRLSRRYGVPVEHLEVGILRAPVMDGAGRPCELEIFAMATPPDLAHIAAEERLHGRERHFALAVPNADPIVLNGLRRTVATRMRPDGGGYNQHENHTVLYFRDAQHPRPEFRRLELISVGEFPHVLATHLREAAAGTQLLRLMTGAWATQAIATAAELHLADHLVTVTDLPSLAAATGADQDSLGRLLCYLNALGLVRTTPTGYALTETGTLLRSDVDGSMRSLALLYGGPFYQSFAALPDAVRTGEESYAKVFGVNHFAHMATERQLAELFHQSMAASNAVFAELARVVEFAGTVVDVAGGNGALLSRILTANPAVRGILLERPHALVAAEANLTPVADRCTLVPGDFTEDVPATGDTYLLSRVLHDWDDTRCHTILSRIQRAMPDHAELLVVERVLAHADTDSLAIPWDIHMLCNVGGRERTEAHYRAMLAAAGFELTSAVPLPLDMYALRARKVSPVA
ncbi:hypothetical protein GCM10029964_019060 [Kibdelosporangium lantanae]